MADAFFQLPPDSSGKQINTDESTVNAQQVHTQRFQLVDKDDVTKIGKVDDEGGIYTRFTEGTPALDAFNNLQVSQYTPEILENFVRDDRPGSFTQTTVGGGAIARTAQTSSMNLQVGTASGDIARLEHNKIVHYVPGVGTRLIFTAWSGDAGKANVVRRMGIFDADNGVFFELDGTTFNFVVRSNATGSVVDTKYPASGWADPLDGTGISGFNLDFTNLNVYWIDYQWLGGGAVRYGVYGPQGERVVANTIQNANAQPRPYMATGSNRLRAEIENTGASGSSSEINIVCVSVGHDGPGDTGREFYGDIQVDGVGVTGADNYVVAVRPKATYAGVTNVAGAEPIGIECFSDQPVRLNIYFGVTGLTGSPTFAGTSAGPLEYDMAATGYTGGVNVRSSFITAGQRVLLDTRLFSEIGLKQINLNADGGQPLIVVTADQIGGTPATDLNLIFRYAEIV